MQNAKQARTLDAKERDMTRKQARRNKQARQAFFYASFTEAKNATRRG